MPPYMTIQNITQLLHAPHGKSAEDTEMLKALLQKYPYFTPGYYISAAQQAINTDERGAMMTRMQLHRGNWLLFSQYLSNISDNDIAFEKLTPEEVVHRPFYTEEIDELPELKEPEIKATPEFIPLNINTEKVNLVQEKADDNLISPIYTEDYFLHQGIQVSSDLPRNLHEDLSAGPAKDEDKSLMIVMSFSEWLLHFKTRNQKEKEEREDQRALKTMWQKEKLAAALEEENEEIPENVFEMAVNSITREEGLVSEALADVYEKQGKHDKAIDMYRKLSLRNPQKNAYFARKIENIQKEKEL